MADAQMSGLVMAWQTSALAGGGEDVIVTRTLIRTFARKVCSPADVGGAAGGKGREVPGQLEKGQLAMKVAICKEPPEERTRKSLQGRNALLKMFYSFALNW